MQTLSPKQQAIIIALISAVIIFLCGVLLIVSKLSVNILLFVFVGLVVFIVVFLFVYYSLNNFIFKRLRPIYKTIYNINLSEEQLKRNIEERELDIVKDVQNDVIRWAKHKTNEIAKLRQFEKYRREFLGNVSHELKTPIFNIQGYISTLLDGGLEDESINRLYLERADKSVTRLISIVNDLESISRLEAGELKLQYKKFNIVRLVSDVFEEHEMLARERQIKLKFAHAFDKPINVNADRQRILEVLNNLIVNSIKYGNEGGSTTVDFLDMEDQLLIEISDDGIGISDKDLPRIFERFYRTDKSRSRDMGGTGLGLSIVKHIIEAHDQTIHVRSKQNHGSAFTFTLSKD